MNEIDQLFTRFDLWRHFPNYQLERRTDIFFSFFLTEVLQEKMGIPIQSIIIPEFPIHKQTIFPEEKINKDNRSFNIDYVTFSSDGTKAFFIELKTDLRSKRAIQDKYLIATQSKRFNEILKGIIEIFLATNLKRKYLFLIEQLELIGLMKIPDKMRELKSHKTLRGINELVGQIQITAKVQHTEIVYIQPTSEDSRDITFKEFSKVVKRHNDYFAVRFSQSLDEWSQKAAGNYSY